jgi:alpha-L-fucosidase 2
MEFIRASALLRTCQFNLLLIVLCAYAMQGAEAPDGKMTLWYARPALDWNEALPLGNGRIGAMVFGAPRWK